MVYQQARLFGLQHHLTRRAILDVETGVQVLALGQNATARGTRQRGQLNQRRVSDTGGQKRTLFRPTFEGKSIKARRHAARMPGA